MMCDLGRLQAYADEALASADAAIVAQHLAACTDCQRQLAAIRERNGRMTSGLALLEPAPGEVPDADGALARFRSETLQARPTVLDALRRGAEMTTRLFAGRWRPISIGVAAIICVAILVSIAPVRQAAADFLGIFRVRKFTAIAVDPAQAQRLESLAKSLDEGAFGKPTTVREAGDPQPVSDAAEASAVAGFPVRVPSSLPDGASLRGFDAQAGPALHFEVDRFTMEAFLSAAGVQDASLPDVEKITADIDAPVMVTQEYTLPGGARVSIVQFPSPEVAVSEGVDPTALGQLGLQILGIPAADAQRIAQEIDWTSTVIIPLPTDIGRSQEVTVDGVTGLLLEETRQGRPGRNSLLMWERDGIIYSIDGQDMDPSLLIQAGDSLR
jgi:hypothetical protein